jgi:hypothetical protein
LFPCHDDGKKGEIDLEKKKSKIAEPVRAMHAALLRRATVPKICGN